MVQKGGTMSILNDLVSKIEDEKLRERIANEIDRQLKQKKFGLVFEEHLPECTPLYGIPIKKGSVVAKKAGEVKDICEVQSISGEKARCFHKDSGETEEIPVNELVCIAEFGEPIYPYLEPMGTVCNAPDSDLWHTLIEADNYHALQLLEYLYAGKVDCIYIDPPYNTGAGEWKYNDKYIDSSDYWSHSKWLAMMKKRLILAKRILSDKGYLVISISYQEYHRLILLCEEIFCDKQVVGVTVQTSGGKPAGGFNYLHEYLVFIVPKDFKPNPMGFSGGKTRSPFEGLTLATFKQTQRPNQTYPIFIDKKNGQIIACGKSLTVRVDEGLCGSDLSKFEFDYNEAPEGTVAVWPVSSKGEHCVWRLISSRLMSDWKKGYIKISPNRSIKNPNEYSIQYLPEGIISKIENGQLEILGTEKGRPTLVLGDNQTAGSDIPTIWSEKQFYTTNGTSQLQDIFAKKAFTYPKPLNLIEEIIRACTNPDSLVVDFFAGSGTTLHAVNLLNAEDGGRRRCIMVTNNEVSAEEAKTLTQKGFQPGDAEWEKLGIARYVTWPRTVCSIEGHDVNGEPLKGNYLGSDIPMAEGFQANAAFFKLGFLDKTQVRLGRQFRELLPILWLKAGAIGSCPTLPGQNTPGILILPENRMAVLTNEKQYPKFFTQMQEHPEIETIYIVTDSEAGYREMTVGLNAKQTYQLYRDYLDNFRINVVRR